MTPNQLAILIAAIAASGAVLASTITAVLGIQNGGRLVRNGGKLEVIHVLVNSRLDEIKEQLATALDATVKAEAENRELRAENRELRAKLATLPPEPPA